MLADTWERPYTRERVRAAVRPPACFVGGRGRLGQRRAWPAHPAQLFAHGCGPRHAPVLPPAPLTPAHPYTRPQAAYPADWVKAAKFWPTTSRVDNVYGDRHLVLRLPQADAAEPQAAVA